MGRGDQVGGVRRSLGVSESLLRQSLLEIDTATFARMVSRGLLHGKTFLSRPLTVRIYFKFSVTQFDNVLWSYLYVFRPCHPPGEPRRLDTWSECTADVLSARLGPDGISREYRRGRSRIPLSRRYLRNVAQCTVERPSKRPSSYMPKLSNVLKARENNTASHAQFFGVLHVGGNRSISKSTSREVASYEACAGASAAV